MLGSSLGFVEVSSYLDILKLIDGFVCCSMCDWATNKNNIFCSVVVVGLSGVIAFPGCLSIDNWYLFCYDYLVVGSCF